MTHDPLCGLAQPCDEEEPEHGYCSMQHGLYCIHCHQWCICNVIAKVREEEQSKDLDYAYVAAQAEADGQRDMLAKCIATIDDRIPLVADNGSWEASIAAAWLRAAITDLQRLEATI